MSTLRLTLKERPPQRVDLSPLTASLRGPSLATIAATALPTGNRTIRVDALFMLSGSPGLEVELAGDLSTFDGIGAGLTEGRLVVRGQAGARLGAGMLGGTIEVEGNVGVYAGTGMRGGLVRVGGNAGEFLAAAIPGDHQGMQGGTILIHGNVGDRAGDRMRRGMVLIEGDAGDYCASRMVAGTLAVWGSVGRFPGLAMRRGTLLLKRAPESFLPTFNDCGTYPLTILSLLARSWRVYAGKFSTLPDTGLRVRRLMGDLANDGRGEILVLA